MAFTFAMHSLGSEGRLERLIEERLKPGAEVNAASKLGEDTAQSGEILVTGAVRDSATLDPGWSFEAIDDCPPGAKAAFKLIYPR